MSLPNPTLSPPLSSSPSKRSIRRAPSGPHSIDRPPTAQPNDVPDEQSYHVTGANLESHPAEGKEEHSESRSISQTPFQPFFTLIEDAHTSEYYHPTVHYIFSDDDTDIVTEAAIRSLETEQNNFPDTKGKSIRRLPQDNEQHLPTDGDADELYGDDRPAKKESLLPDPVPGVRDNYIILDIDHIPSVHGRDRPDTVDTQPQAQQPDQQQQQQSSTPELTVTSAHSLTPSWQVLNTQLLPAPTFDNNPSGEKPLNGGLMLQIQGTSGLPINIPGKDKERGSQRLEDMMDQFAKRLDELRMVIESGERGLPHGFQEDSLHEALRKSPDGTDAENHPDLSLTREGGNGGQEPGEEEQGGPADQR